MTRREKVAIANIAGVLAGWLLAIASVAVILLLQGRTSEREEVEQAQHAERSRS